MLGLAPENVRAFYDFERKNNDKKRGTVRETVQRKLQPGVFLSTACRILPTPFSSMSSAVQKPHSILSKRGGGLHSPRGRWDLTGRERCLPPSPRTGGDSIMKPYGAVICRPVGLGRPQRWVLCKIWGRAVCGKSSRSSRCAEGRWRKSNGRPPLRLVGK